MPLLCLSLKPQSAFSSALLGDTLFGQLCWALRDAYGEEFLTSLLQDYTQGRPFAVVSNAFPQGFLPRPTIPGAYLHKRETEDADPRERKRIKKQVWLPTKALYKPMQQWQQGCKSDKELVLPKANEWPKKCNDKQVPSDADDCLIKFQKDRLQLHNTINRLTGTTSDQGQFAPYGMQQYWFLQNTRLKLYLFLDEKRLSRENLREAFQNIGDFGFGRDASIGMGKFSVESLEAVDEDWRKAQANANQNIKPNAYFTLAPCAPQGLGFNGERSFYSLFTRFGRHGNVLVHKKAKPFKNPVLMTKAGAIFTPILEPEQTFAIDKYFIGQGLGGVLRVRKDGSKKGILSRALPETVHQAYAPVLPVHLPQLD